MWKVKNHWPQTATSQSMLLFALSLQEMLWHQSWDNYKAHALNSFYRLVEASVVLSDIRARSLPRTMIDPVFEELSSTFFIDPLVRKILNNDILYIEKLFKSGKSNFREIEHLIPELQSRISSKYGKLIEDQIAEEISNAHRSKSIYRLSQIYCSQLINIGYSRRYILEKLYNTFWNKDHKRIDARKIRRFFNIFDGKYRKYEVFLKIKKSACVIYEDLLGSKAYRDTTNIPNHAMQIAPNFFNSPNDTSFIQITIEALDPFSARRSAENIAELMFASSRLTPHRRSNSVGSDAVVTFPRSGGMHISRRDVSPVFRKRPQSISIVSDRLKKVMSVILEKQNSNDGNRFFRSIRLWNMATETTSEDLQLSTIWSAIETLLSEPRDEQSRISHYKDLLVPIICRNYCSRTLFNFWADIQFLIGHQNANDYLEKIPEGGDELEKILYLVSSERYSPIRQRILSKIFNAPLSRIRFQIMTEHFKDPKSLYNFVKSHNDRIGWQIHRIYRVRNMIVHSGRSLQINETLIMNLDEYYLNLIHCIVDHHIRRDHSIGIDSSVYSSSVDFYIGLEKLKSIHKDDTWQSQVHGLII